MKPILTPLILAAPLFFWGCSKTGNGNKAITNNPTSYILKKLTLAGADSWGQSTEFSYNSNNLVSQITTVRWTRGSIYGQPTATRYDTTSYHFEYTNGLVTKATLNSIYNYAYYIYEYNGANLLFRRTLYQPYISYDSITHSFNPDTLKRYNLYSYDSRRNLIEVIDSTWKTHFRHEFTYDDSNNMTSETIYELDYRPQTKVKSEWGNYDNKVNFVKAINGLPVTFRWDNSFSAYSSCSSGNFMLEKSYSTVIIDQPFIRLSLNNYSYTYNEDGLPTKIAAGPSVTTLEYQRFRK